MELKQIPIVRTCCGDDCMAAVAHTKFAERQVAHRADVFSALGDPIRLKMVELLARHDALCVCELEQAFDIGQPTVSHHLKVLRDAGLIDVQRRGTWAYYSLLRETLKDLMSELVAVV
jgi:ArsR family transcriptional regulator